MKAEATKQIEFTLATDKTFTISVTAYAIQESNYGADADGNRGICAVFIEDWSYVPPLHLSPAELDELEALVEAEVMDGDFEFNFYRGQDDI
jgi:hypothetical protein